VFTRVTHELGPRYGLTRTTRPKWYEVRTLGHG